jgi:CheY-like chemotaxis protein
VFVAQSRCRDDDLRRRLVARPHVTLVGCIIDDDNLVADTLAMVLNFSGYDGVAVYSGQHGLELAQQVAYDHLLTDVMMEPMNVVITIV